MRIVVAGGSNFVGPAVLRELKARGHEAVAASRTTGFDVMTGAGLDEAFEGADVVVDTLHADADSPLEVIDIFRRAGRKLLEAASRAGVKHFVLFSTMGADRLSLGGFFLAKLTQENLVRTSNLPFTILRSAPLFETIHAITTDADVGGEIRLPPLLMQPLAADDAAAALADIALSSPANAVLELTGPETLQLTELALAILTVCEDGRRLSADAQAPYLGAVMGSQNLVAYDPWRVAGTRFDDWLRRYLAAA